MAYHPDLDNPSWQIDLVAAFFVHRSGIEASNIVAQLAHAIGVADDGAARKTIAERLIPFLEEILPSKTLKVQIAGIEEKVIGPSGPDGICKNTIKLPDGDWKDGQVIETLAMDSPHATKAHTTFAGWAVISDIDDSIKKTLTNSALGILKTTFVDAPEPISGMPELYQKIVERLSNPPFWYLSASPYNLYPFLREFRDKYYPIGTILLRDASWQNLAGFLGSLTMGTRDYKVDHINRIFRWWPGRKFICIGDDTQQDPESYGECYRSHPGWIRAIWIRRVRDVKEIGDNNILPGHNQESRGRPERFKKAFENVPEEVWCVFDDPEQLYEKLEALDLGSA